MLKGVHKGNLNPQKSELRVLLGILVSAHEHVRLHDGGHENPELADPPPRCFPAGLSHLRRTAGLLLGMGILGFWGGGGGFCLVLLVSLMVLVFFSGVSCFCCDSLCSLESLVSVFRGLVFVGLHVKLGFRASALQRLVRVCSHFWA